MYIKYIYMIYLYVLKDYYVTLFYLYKKNKHKEIFTCKSVLHTLYMYMITS